MDCNERETSDVELSPLIEQWVLDVLLYYRSSTWISAVGLNKSSDFVEVRLHLNALPSVRIFSWFYNPNILRTHFLTYNMGNLLIMLLKGRILRIASSSFYMKSEWDGIKQQFSAVASDTFVQIGFLLLIRIVFLQTAVRVIVPHVEKECFLVIQMLVELQSVIDLLELSFALLKNILQLNQRNLFGLVDLVTLGRWRSAAFLR